LSVSSLQTIQKSNPGFSVLHLVHQDARNSNEAHEIRRLMVQANADHLLIEPDDRVLVAVSGGKDSSIMLALLEQIRRRAPFPFTLEAVIVDQKQPGFFADHFVQWVASLGIRLTVLEEDTYSIVKEKVPENKTFCSLCSRLRRGILYTYAKKNGYTKIALGHHRDDLIETLFLNMFYGGRLATMPPKLFADDQENIVIRPLVYVKESQLTELAKAWRFPVIPCNLCGSQEGLKRQKMKELVSKLREDIPNLDGSLLTALGNVQPSHLLDKNLFKKDPPAP
jgi:tRNA 2-thiocytidine biosynthesis protein TtcA